MEHNGDAIVMIDIDGVCNVFDGWEVEVDEWMSAHTKKPWIRNRKAPAHLKATRARGYNLLLNPEHPEWMAEIEDTGAEMVWGTMWVHTAATEFAPVAGFGAAWSHIPFNDYHVNTSGRRMGEGVANYKMPGIADWAEDRPVVWVDDDLTPAEHAWAARRNARGLPTLFIQPDPAVGMTRAHVEQILDFIAEHHYAEFAENGERVA